MFDKRRTHIIIACIVILFNMSRRRVVRSIIGFYYLFLFFLVDVVRDIPSTDVGMCISLHRWGMLCPWGMLVLYYNTHTYYILIYYVHVCLCVSPIVRNGIKRWRRDKTSDAGLTYGQKRKILINDLRGDFFSSPVVNVTATTLLTTPTARSLPQSRVNLRVHIICVTKQKLKPSSK